MEKKLIGIDEFIFVKPDKLKQLAKNVMLAIGCSEIAASDIAKHLINSDLGGVKSHGNARLSQYVKQAQDNLWTPSGMPTLSQNNKGAWICDGHDGMGILAVRLAVEKACDLATLKTDAGNNRSGFGIASVGVVNCGHTGRIGEMAEEGAKRGCLTFIISGGTRKEWRQVAPYGGRKGMLPTNPYAISIPADRNGPVTLDFATGATAGGWVLAAKKSNAKLKPNLIMDKFGNPSQDPQDYLDGGAILPAAGHKGYGLGLVAELIAYSILGKVAKAKGLGLNTMVIALDVTRYRALHDISGAASEILEELKASPPAPGFEKVEIPGQREHSIAAMTNEIKLTKGIWDDIRKVANELNIKNIPSVRNVVNQQNNNSSNDVKKNDVKKKQLMIGVKSKL